MLNFFSFLKSSKPGASVARALIIFYQGTFAHFLGGRCRYYPSCSHYSLAAYENFSFFLATKLVIIRILSCHPFSRKQQYDPVPSRHQETSAI